MQALHRDGARQPSKPRRRVSYSAVTATLALVFAIGGGTALAAHNHYLIFSIHQIKPKVVRELRGQRGPRGYRGYRGPAGPSGATGASGATLDRGRRRRGRLFCRERNRGPIHRLGEHASHRQGAAGGELCAHRLGDDRRVLDRRDHPVRCDLFDQRQR